MGLASKIYFAQAFFRSSHLTSLLLLLPAELAVMILLIDNCSLLQLINSQGYGHFLVQLENYVNSGNISLVTHQHILDEWEKHKERDKRKKAATLFKHAEISEPIDSLPASLMPVQIRHLDLQSDKIDLILGKASVIPTPEGIKNEFANRYRNKLAPFSRKLDSLNDWEIIGSVCQYCENYSIPHLFFISSNHSDFADPSDKDRTIHLDIQCRFQSVKINYYRQFQHFFEELDSSVLPHTLISYNIVRNEKYTFSSSVKKSALESLHYLFENTYREIGFIPIHILSKFYPFASSEKTQAHYSIYSLYNVNEDLVNLFSQVMVDENGEIQISNEDYFKGTKDYRIKLQEVMENMGQNLIFYISGKAQQRVRTYITRDGYCDCVRCNFNRLKFTEAFSQLVNKPVEIKEKLKYAYINYLLRNYNIAAKLLLEVRDEVFKRKNYITYFIVQYNLRHLAVFLGSVFYTDLSDEIDVESLKAIDPIEECVKLKSHTDYDLICYIAKGDFFNWNLQEMLSLLDKIMKHYQSQLRGGWSSNGYVWELMESFTEMESMISNNYIFYEGFTNYRAAFELVAKGMLASHAMDDKQEGTFDEFNDYWVSKYIRYGNSSEIYRFFNQFKLEKLVYKRNSTGGEAFIDLAENLFGNWAKNKVSVDCWRNSGSDFFSDRVTVIFDNVLCMATLLDLGEDDLNRFGAALLHLMHDVESIDRRNFQGITSFLGSKGKLLKKEVIESFVSMFIEGLDHYDYQFLSASLKDITVSQRKNISLDGVLERILRKLKGSAITSNYDLVINLFKAANESERKAITSYIKTSLEAEFDFELFYVATIADIIPLDKNKLFELLEAVSGERMENRTTFFRRPRNTNETLNALLNICFKFEISTLSKRFNKFKNISDYYEWLIDMDRYNYERFDMEWLNLYGTVHYFKKMSRSMELKSYLLSELKNNPNSLIKDTYMRVYHFSNEIGK